VLTSVGIDPDVLMAHSARRLWLNLSARLKNAELDSQLASGIAPERSGLLFSHAVRIVRPRGCAVLASSLRRVVADSERWRGRSNRVPLARANVQTAERELVGLAERLERPGPIRARGVAEIRLLLGDGTGPLYRGGSGRRLLDELRVAAAHL
jgi:hypothetical protein